MTEKEAKKKACCNGNAAPHLSGPCIGAACMAWRWDQMRNPDYNPHSGMMAVYPPRAEVPSYIRDPKNGHCGLAGHVS